MNSEDALSPEHLRDVADSWLGTFRHHYESLVTASRIYRGYWLEDVLRSASGHLLAAADRMEDAIDEELADA